MFRSQTIRQCLLALLMSLLTFAAQAQSLSDSTIRAFIASLQDTQTLQEKYAGTDQWPEPDTKNMESMPDMSRLFSSGVEQMKDYPAFNELEGMVENHGFDSAEEWASVGDRVFHAMMAIEMTESNPGMNQEMADAMAEIDNNSSLSAEQKAQMKAMMSGAMGMVQTASDAPEADVKAVRPHMAELRAAMDSEAK